MCEWCRDNQELYNASYNSKFDDPYFASMFTHGLYEDGTPYDEMILRPSGSSLKAWGKTEFKWAPNKMPVIDDSWVDDWLRKFAGKGDNETK